MMMPYWPMYAPQNDGSPVPNNAQEGTKNTEESPAESPQPQEAAAPEEADDTPNSEDVEEEPVVPVEVLSEEEILTRRVGELEGKLRTVSKAYTDAQSEMDAFRKRQTQLAEIKVQRKAGEVVEQFFEPVQNLKRCLEAASDDAESLLQGVQMVVSQFNDRLDKLGLTEVPGVGAPFDPSFHNALAVTPVTDPAQDGIILMVHATGYSLGSRVIQASQVVIGQYKENPPEA